jgi:hypothetical protein
MDPRMFVINDITKNIARINKTNKALRFIG